MGIVGAGASGMSAAIAAARQGARVTLLEKNPKPGRKILATGNGRCNISNLRPDPSRFHGGRPGFVRAALQRFSPKQCRTFFSDLGIEMTEGEEGRLYPLSQQASAVADALAYECRRLGAELLLETEVTGAERRENGFFLHTSGGGKFFSRLIVASGGMARPNLGAGDIGYRIAEGLGHRVENPLPSLVQLTAEAPFLKRCSGVKVAGTVTLLVEGKERQTAEGDLLFADYGISGSAVLDVSRAAVTALEAGHRVEASLDLLPGYGRDALAELLRKRAEKAHGKGTAFWLEGVMNKKLVPGVLDRAGVGPEEAPESLGRKRLGKIAYAAKNLVLPVTGSRGFATCETTAGGVATEELDPETMESRLVPGLYFCGEVTDVDGDCGGFNLHWAWASGWAAGTHGGK